MMIRVRSASGGLSVPCLAAAGSGTSRNHAKSFIFTRIYKGFGLLVRF